jgi:hypothetical protein
MFANLAIPLVLVAVGGVIGLVLVLILASKESASLLGIGAAVVGAVVVGMPIAVVLRVLALGGIEHLLLMLLGATRHPFQATLRGHCYASGASVFALVPGCGFYISEIWQIVSRIIAYRSVHSTTGGRAAAAVLIPTGLFAVGYAALIAFTR